MRLTTNESASLTNLSARTIQKYIKQGKLSAIKNHNGIYEIEASELQRIFPNIEISNIASSCEQDVSCVPSNDDEKKFMKKEIEDLKTQLQEYKTRENKLLETIDKSMRLIEHNTKKKKKFLFF